MKKSGAEELPRAVISDNGCTIGVFMNGKAYALARLMRPIGDEWTQLLAEEWPKGDGALIRAIKRVDEICGVVGVFDCVEIPLDRIVNISSPNTHGDT